MKYAWWILFGLLLAAYLFLARPDPILGEGIRAAAALKANQRLRPGDVEVGSGHAYVSRDIEKGQPIGADDLQGWPALPATRGALLVAFAVREADAATLDAGDVAQLCPAPENGPTRVRIASVICSSVDDGCIALGILPVGQAEPLAAEQQAGRGRSAGGSCG
jgi:hypothetical protein